MSRVQLALRVADLEGSIAFYSKRFGAEPAKRRPGYANFAIAEPPLKLVLIEGTEGEPTRMDHLGVEVETTGEVTAATSRLAAAGLVTATEEDTACCYALASSRWRRVRVSGEYSGLGRVPAAAPGGTPAVTSMMCRSRQSRGVRQPQEHRSPVPQLTERSRKPECPSTDSRPVRLLPITMSGPPAPALGE
jgi:catechol 2,3-dioxygenase-like lactoylglutathione lyase family enzyme